MSFDAYKAWLRTGQVYNRFNVAVPMLGLARAATADVTGNAHVLSVDSAGRLIVVGASAEPIPISVPGALTCDTELPSAVSPADALSASASPSVLSLLFGRDTNAATFSRVSVEYASATATASAGGDVGIHTSPIPRRRTSLAFASARLDNSPTSVSGDAIDCSRFREGRFYISLQSSASPTDITFYLEFSPNGTDWHREQIWWWSNNVFDDTVCATEIHRTWPFRTAGAEKVRVVVVGAGTTVANWFELDNARFTFIG